MARSIYHPDVFPKFLNTKKGQLSEIEGTLRRLPFDDPSRLRLLEQMHYLQKTIPDLEAELARRTGNGQRLGDKARVGIENEVGETLRFVRRGRKLVAEQSGDMGVAVANTYKLLLPHIQDAKSIVRSSKGKITARALQSSFRNTYFVKALDESDWDLLIEEFRNKRPAGCRNLAIGILARRTGRSIATVDKYTKPSWKRKMAKHG